jgi:DNA primase
LRGSEIDIARREVIVTEGIIDALSAAAGGYRAAAVLGAGYPDARTAAALERLDGRLVVAFDPDPAGRAGSDRLVQLLNARGRRPSVMPLEHGDLNDNLIRSEDWPTELAFRVEHAKVLTVPGRASPPTSAPAALER